MTPTINHPQFSSPFFHFISINVCVHFHICTQAHIHTHIDTDHITNANYSNLGFKMSVLQSVYFFFNIFYLLTLFHFQNSHKI